MRYDEFLAEVRELGEYRDQQEAEQVTTAVLSVLATRLPGPTAEKLAAQLPEPLREGVREAEQPEAESFGVEEFHSRVAELLGGRALTAEQDTGAVLTTVAEAVSGGELNQLLSHLPSGYAVMFGKAELS
ncbi:hypothetical protein GCM10007079_23490 [Nocardiopsis terrae]|uniref:Uncharacterized protein (DUF2267 family) n=1 Tax=Nocardiopsis terrae TaxID=372655 RepID=A0ABR9HG86_9ACTN|nr:DUF2267 domain-containing protein [Nocardiopsis terrae]MBE1458045.1 uncharacterized protein (DUF2267 family) [Nocardiopsis terrae]GHC82514.1 hypothetical protein GCM10007079_23490 [Nocardiopsis terrae]